MRQILTVGLLVWSTAQAVELGAIAVSSATGQPFTATIPILLKPDQTLEDVSAAILATAPNVTDISLVLADSPSPAIRLSTKEPVSLDKFDLTLQINDPKEDHEYHYELTLAPAGKLTAVKPFTYGPVKQGDTLWHVASQFAKHYKLTPEQATEALYEHNAKAFSKGNKDQLMAGSVLKLPASMAKNKPSKQTVVKFEPKEVITQAHATDMTIPEFPEMEAGKQVAINLPGALKSLNPLKDVDAALFSNTLQSVLGAEESAVASTLTLLQNDLRVAREAIDLEREAKMALQSQVEDLQVQLRAVTELISLQEVRTGESSPVASTHFPAFSFDNTQNQILLIIAAIGLASLLMYAWDQWKGRKPAVVSVRTAAPAPRVTTEKLTQMAHAMPSDVYEGDPPSDPVQTKLDLARAYIDIGDKVSAREILLEVIQEGNASQKMSAEVLITQMD